ncbi:DOPA-like domain-containing protein [Armillaria fumosa]|nr:DOPA-like domain-containing protein [Armillaria fumosa]
MRIDSSREWKLIPSIPETDVATVTSNEIKEYHFHIYFHQTNATEHHFALELRDAVLRFCRDGAFVAVPLFRVNTEANGPHPVGSYEIWVPVESFASIFSFIVKNHGKLSVLIHPLTIDEVPTRDHEHRTAWIGQPFPLDLSWVVERLDSVPLQYPTLSLLSGYFHLFGFGYSSTVPPITLEQRRKDGARIVNLLRQDKLAVRPPAS